MVVHVVQQIAQLVVFVDELIVKMNVFFLIKQLIMSLFDVKEVQIRTLYIIYMLYLYTN
ncbi:MAG: hypothetical protein H6Q13_1970 [Bacteroidetes bacterium]|nr:hypothetical protein [Bacteroidota bacterium]